MADAGKNKPIKVPVAQNQTMRCTITPPWFVDKSEYNALTASFQPLVNGERAFRAVHQAIEAAKKSVCIICWGFQPSMYFIRDGKSPCIGELLRQKAKQGVKVKVLGWRMGPAGSNLAQYGPENNQPGGGLFSSSPTATPEQRKYDHYWYGNSQHLIANPRFVGRDFSLTERAEILYRSLFQATDTQLRKTTSAVQAATVTHHQKMVLVDYEDPQRAVGFVMGHNMLDEYWDKDAHSCKRYPPHLGPNGHGPRQDISSRVTGPIVGDLFANFWQAWKKETGETLPKPDFRDYPARPDSQNLPIQGQILRTQAQYNVRDIEKLYLQAVNNASTMIYIENQYFRWPPLADKIKAAAQAQTRCGRDPGKHDSLYLFVVTNSCDEGMGDGTVKTYEMLDSLGRAETIPNVARLERAQDLQTQMNRTEVEIRQTQLERNMQLIPSGYANKAKIQAYQQQKQALEAKQAALEARKRQQAARKAALEQPDAPILPEERPGLKVHVCTLVAPDSEPTTPDSKRVRMKYPMSAESYTVPGRDWTPVYIHSKLMIVNDTFMTLGSANINTRSMQVDSELNIAHHRPEITPVLRRQLWNIHTKGMGAQDKPKDAYQKWLEIINENRKANAKFQTPIASLVEFSRLSATRTNKD
ncbi:hypothetical protein JW897_16585 [Chromobacterium alkanivorans]|uniref:phospholipase D-like domain-containing protein n=1 Tax=Chromobacterium alkanivorans TaxID=1071719 RepID=UPI001966EA3C|nr:phospholipase D-like domain-containing protein [Chromobacterium alkanivorans]MBN3005355.1 hypothetical protein [Chromobacterium alkanivorans]